MRTLLVLIRKEFIQIGRNRTLLPMMFVIPIVQMLVLVYAANLNMRNIDFVIVDECRSSLSRELAGHFQGSPFFRSRGEVMSIHEAENLLRNDAVDLIIHIPENLERNIQNGKSADLQLLINGINNTAAVLTSAYSQSIIRTFLLNQTTRGQSPNTPPRLIKVSYSHWYNPELDFKIFMVPGILVILVTMVGWILTSLNIVKEKEMGTIEQINVTPVKKYQFLMAKLIPFWLIALFELAFGLLIGRIVFEIPILGSLGLLFLFAGVYLLSVLGIGLLIAAISETQLQVMFLNFFFMLTFILMSGIFTPVESMPDWADIVNYLNPLSYFMKVIRMILLKGAGFQDVWKEFLQIGVLGFLMITLAVRAYRKRV